MKPANDDDRLTPQERRIVELQDLIEAADDDADAAKWEHELERISLMSDEAFEANLREKQL